jgi:4-nitrophenyl phosphatase
LLWQDEVFGSAYAAAAYLSSVLNFPMDKKVYVIGMSGLEDELRSEGISFIGGTVGVTLTRHPSMRISFTVAGSSR